MLAGGERVHSKRREQHMQRPGGLLLCHLRLGPKCLCWNRLPEAFLGIDRNLLSYDKTALCRAFSPDVPGEAAWSHGTHPSLSGC